MWIDEKVSHSPSPRVFFCWFSKFFKVFSGYNLLVGIAAQCVLNNPKKLLSYFHIMYLALRDCHCSVLHFLRQANEFSGRIQKLANHGAALERDSTGRGLWLKWHPLALLGCGNGVLEVRNFPFYFHRLPLLGCFHFAFMSWLERSPCTFGVWKWCLQVRKFPFHLTQ